ncbi:fibroblast growth factor 8-like [Dendronephthya gigantea]|uniref:fibroblast growth factor 8-like n=1 Tax=Dendronephthya gigantea TaxID=151771 RepID=UPI00106CBCE9|nr:fibroblast growth factor 8-like [Dendronephthya gigantea]XP_028398578.1 fibroblast growth factor 8-like [Dendronephthya gigantea]
MYLRRKIQGIMFVMLAVTTATLTSTNSSPAIDLSKVYLNDVNSKPQLKYLQLYNRLTDTYVRITTTAIDVKSINQSDPDTYLQIDMFGPTMLAIRRYPNGKYVCHNTKSGNVELKTVQQIPNNLECVFHRIPNKDSYHSYRSEFNQTWLLAFYGKGGKTGRPKKGSKTSLKNKGSMYLEMPLKLPKRNGS